MSLRGSNVHFVLLPLMSLGTLGAMGKLRGILAECWPACKCTEVVGRSNESGR